MPVGLVFPTNFDCNTKLYSNSPISIETKNVDKSREKFDKSTLLAVGAVATAAIAVGVLIYRGKYAKSKKIVENSKENIVQATNDVREYTNATVVSKLKNLVGGARENVDNIKNIFMDELGYPRNILSIKSSNKLQIPNLFSAETMFGGFNYLNGEFILNAKLLNIMSKEELAVVIRHELDHFDKAVKLCKAIGIDEYEKIFKSVDPMHLVGLKGEKLSFDKEFWQNAIKYANIDGFDAKFYLNAFKKRFNPIVNDASYYSKYSNQSQYVDDEFEKSAFAIQNSLEKSLKCKQIVVGFETLNPTFKKLDAQLDEIVKLYPPEYKVTKTILFQRYIDDAMSELDPKLAELKTKLLKEPNNQELLNELLKLQVKYTNKLNGNSLTPVDLDYTRKVFEIMIDLSKNKLSDSELLKVFDARRLSLIKLDANKYMYDGQDVSKIIIKSIDDMIAFVCESKVETEPSTLLSLYAQKVLYSNGFDKLVWFLKKNASFDISDEVRQQIYKNPAFRQILKSNNLEETSETQAKLLNQIIVEVGDALAAIM